MSKRVTIAMVVFLGIAMEAGVWARTVQYPVDGDGSYKVNLTRHYDPNGVLTTSGALANQVNCSPQASVAGTFDGAGGGLQWVVSNFATRSNASASVRITLHRSYPINKIVTEFMSWIPPAYYTLRISDTGFASMTTVVESNAVGAVYTHTDVFAPVTGRYIELTWYGGCYYDGVTSYAGIIEIMIYPNAASTGALTTDDGYNVITAIAPTATNDPSLGGGWYDAVGQLFDGSIDSYLRGNNTLSPNSARLGMDMGQTFIVRTVAFCCYGGQSWGNGGKLETSVDGATYETIMDQSTPISGTMTVVIPVAKEVRYFRITDYQSNSGAIEEFEVHALPFPKGTVIECL